MKNTSGEETEASKGKMPEPAEVAMSGFPSHVKREVRSFWRKHGELAIHLGTDRLKRLVSRVALGEAREVRSEMYRELSDSERIAFDRSVTRELVASGNRRLQEVAFMGDLERDLRGLALGAFSVALNAISSAALDAVDGGSTVEAPPPAATEDF